MEPNKKPRCKQKIMLPEALALRKMREIRGLSRKEASTLLGIGHKAIEKIENGKTNLKQPRIIQFVGAYGLTYEDFLLCRKGKSEQIQKRFCHKSQLVIDKNKDRRFNKKIITKEAKVLKVLRQLKNLSQRKASLICGYHKTAICFIENGRVELHSAKISHIVKSYGFTVEDFEHHMEADSFITDIQDECISIIKALGEKKLKAVHPLLLNFSNYSPPSPLILV